MKEYEVEVSSSETIYVTADNKEEAMKKAVEQSTFSSVDYCEIIGEKEITKE